MAWCNDLASNSSVGSRRPRTAVRKFPLISDSMSFNNNNWFLIQFMIYEKTRKLFYWCTSSSFLPYIVMYCFLISWRWAFECFTSSLMIRLSSVPKPFMAVWKLLAASSISMPDVPLLWFGCLPITFSFFFLNCRRK